jgi:hypothetical protein
MSEQLQQTTLSLAMMMNRLTDSFESQEATVRRLESNVASMLEMQESAPRPGQDLSEYEETEGQSPSGSAGTSGSGMV